MGIFDRRAWQSLVSETMGKGSPKLPALSKGKSEINQSWFEKFIPQFIASDPANSLEQEFSGERIYKEPLLGFVRGDEPIFEEYKKYVGPFHHTPAEVIAWAAKQQGVSCPPSSEIGVVSFILPLNDQIVKDNQVAKDWGSGALGPGQAVRRDIHAQTHADHDQEIGAGRSACRGWRFHARL